MSTRYRNATSNADRDGIVDVFAWWLERYEFFDGDLDRDIQIMISASKEELEGSRITFASIIDMCKAISPSSIYQWKTQSDNALMQSRYINFNSRKSYSLFRNVIKTTVFDSMYDAKQYVKNNVSHVIAYNSTSNRFIFKLGNDGRNSNLLYSDDNKHICPHLNIKYTSKTESKNDDGDTIIENRQAECAFSKLFSMSYIHEYSELIWRPFNMDIKKSNPNFRQERLNIFVPFLAKKIDAFDCWDYRACDSLEFKTLDWGLSPESAPVDAVLKFIYMIIANKDKNVYEYIIKWLAFMVKHPEQKPLVSLFCFSNKKGCGKSWFLDFISKYVIGQHNVVSTGIAGLANNFNADYQGKKLVYIDDCSKSTTQADMVLFNSFITSDRLTIEPKGEKRFEIDNYINLWINSNHKSSINITQASRRWMCFEISEYRCQDTKYFGMLTDKCYNSDCGDAFYTYLLSIDVCKSDVANGYKTALFNEMALEQAASIDSFIGRLKLSYKAFTDGSSEIAIDQHYAKSELYAAYKLYHSDNSEIDQLLSGKEFFNNAKRLLTYKRVAVDGRRSYKFVL